MSRRMLALWGLVVALSLSFSSVALAQGRGFGGGMGRGMGGGGPLALVGLEPVQKELGIEKDSPEAAEIKKLTEALGKETQEEIGKITGGDPMALFSASPEERQQMQTKMGEATQKLAAKYTPDLKKLLKTEQFTRLQQIGWQAAGPAAYSDAEIVKALEITKEQQEKLTAITTEFGTKQREMFQELFAGGGGGDREAMQKKMAELNTERDKKIAEVITKAQTEKFAKLKGKEFDVASLRPQGGFGGGRGGAGGGGAGGGGGRRRPENKDDNKGDKKE